MAGKRGGPNGDFPLDRAFDDLRKVVEGVTAAFGGLRGAVAGAGAGAGAAGASRGGSGGGGPNVDFLKDLAQIQNLFSQIKATKEGLTAGGKISNALGLPDAANQLDKMAKRVELIGNLGTGIVSTVRTLRSAFLPVVGTIGLVVAGLVGMQQITRATTGSTITLKEEFQLLGLRLKQTFKEGVVVYREFSEAVSGRTRETIENLRDARAEVSEVQADINKIVDEIANRGPATAAADLTMAQVFADSKAQLGELATAAAGVINEAFSVIDAAVEQKTKVEPKIEPTAFDNFKTDLARIGDLTANTLDFVAGGIQQLSATISSALLDAFLDPQADIRESFGNLFKALAQQLLQILIQALVVKAIAGAGFADGGSIPAGGTGLAEGGKIPTRGRASLAHFFGGARGLALGGRPPGLDPRDTVPIWAQPGEFMEPVRSVKHYGLKVMEGIRSLSIPREPLMALAAGVPAAAPSPEARVSYATGGSIGVGASRSEGGGGAVAAYVVASESALDRQLRAGPGAMLRFFRENRSQIKSALG